MAKDPALTDGVIGLSNSKVALPSQLAQKGIMSNVIGLCLSGGSINGGYLFFGDAWVPTSGMTWVSMMGRPQKYVNIISIHLNISIHLSIFHFQDLNVACDKDVLLV